MSQWFELVQLTNKIIYNLQFLDSLTQYYIPIQDPISAIVWNTDATKYLFFESL